MTASELSVSSLSNETARDGTLSTKRASVRRYALLDCWRGIACLMVMVAHAGETAGMKYTDGQVPISEFAGQCVAALGALGAGVQIFFVISGYCISATVSGFAEQQKSVTQYFARRFWRIYPAYWAMFMLMAVAVSFSEMALTQGWIPSPLHNRHSPFALTGSQLLGNVTLTETWRYHLFGSDRNLFLKHAWTLCYEEQFYLIVGLLLLFFPRRFFQSIVGVTMASLALFVASAFHLIDVTGFGFDLQWHPFAFGVLVYYRLNLAGCQERQLIDRSLFVVALLATVANCVPWNWSELSYRIVRGLAISTVFSWLLIVLYRWDTALVALRPFKLLAMVGGISYSLYLVHAPIVAVLARVLQRAGLSSDLQTLLVTVPLCVGISLPLAWGFFILFERPFLYRPTLLQASPNVITE